MLCTDTIKPCTGSLPESITYLFQCPKSSGNDHFHSSTATVSQLLQCQVLFGLEGIKPSLPCCVLIYYLRHFHIRFILVKLGASVVGSGFGWDGAAAEPGNLQRCDTAATPPAPQENREIEMPSGIPVLDISRNSVISPRK